MWKKGNPPHDGNYLVLVARSQHHILYWNGYKWSGHPFDNGLDIAVTHWQKLPKLPDHE